jgi:hypothetical protein
MQNLEKEFICWNQNLGFVGDILRSPGKKKLQDLAKAPHEIAGPPPPQLNRLVNSGKRGGIHFSTIMANDWDVNTGTILRTSSRQSIATIRGCNSHLRIRSRIYLPWERGTIITGVRFPRPAGLANVGLAWYPPAPSGAVVLVGRWVITVKPLGSQHSGNRWDRECSSILPTRAPRW